MYIYIYNYIHIYTWYITVKTQGCCNMQLLQGYEFSQFDSLNYRISEVHTTWLRLNVPTFAISMSAYSTLCTWRSASTRHYYDEKEISIGFLNWGLSWLPSIFDFGSPVDGNRWKRCPRRPVRIWPPVSLLNKNSKQSINTTIKRTNTQRRHIQDVFNVFYLYHILLSLCLSLAL